MFRRAEQLRPSSFATLDVKAQRITDDSMSGAAGGVDPIVAAFNEGRANSFIGYCSGRAQRGQDPPRLLFTPPRPTSSGPPSSASPS